LLFASSAARQKDPSFLDSGGNSQVAEGLAGKSQAAENAFSVYSGCNQASVIYHKNPIEEHSEPVIVSVLPRPVNQPKTEYRNERI